MADLSEILKSEWKKRGLKNVKTLHGMPGNSDAVCPHCQAYVWRQLFFPLTTIKIPGLPLPPMLALSESR